MHYKLRYCIAFSVQNVFYDTTKILKTEVEMLSAQPTKRFSVLELGSNTSGTSKSAVSKNGLQLFTFFLSSFIFHHRFLIISQ